MSSLYKLKRPQEVASPSLLLIKHLVEQNIGEMIAIAGDVDRLRPHIKTHKSAHIIAMLLRAGITKFKCATIAEAELLGQEGAPDVLISYQLSGPQIKRLVDLRLKYPHTQFSVLADNSLTVQALGSQMDTEIPVYIDLDVGMHRTGVPPSKALELVKEIEAQPRLNFVGWHVYDGHIRYSDFTERQAACNSAFEPVKQLLVDSGITKVIAGGSPTFPVHALNPHVELSPGTSVLWDYRYQQILPDLPFIPAAVLLTRVISKPAGDLLCLDLGHKAVASEMPHPRIHLEDLEVVEFTNHSEEHLVVRTPQAPDFAVGDVLYAIPMHICPTSALHQDFLVVEDGEIVDRWPVGARDRRLTV